MDYFADSLTPEYNVGFDIGWSPDGGVAVKAGGNVSSPAACTTCGRNQFLNVSFPLVLVAIAVIVLVLRK